MKTFGPALCILGLLTCTAESQDEELRLGGDLNNIPSLEFARASAEYGHVIVASAQVSEFGTFSLVAPTQGVRVPVGAVSNLFAAALRENGAARTNEDSVLFMDSIEHAAMRPRPVDAAELAVAADDQIVWYCCLPRDVAAALDCTKTFGKALHALPNGPMLELMGPARQVREALSVNRDLEVVTPSHVRVLAYPEGVDQRIAARTLSRMFLSSPSTMQLHFEARHAVVQGSGADVTAVEKALKAMGP